MQTAITKLGKTGFPGAPAYQLRYLFPEGTLVAGDASVVWAVLPTSPEVLMFELDLPTIDVFYSQCDSYTEAVGLLTLCAVALAVDEGDTAPAVGWHEVGEGLEGVRRAAAATQELARAGRRRVR